MLWKCEPCQHWNGNATLSTARVRFPTVATTFYEYESKREWTVAGEEPSGKAAMTKVGLDATIIYLSIFFFLHFHCICTRKWMAPIDSLSLPWIYYFLPFHRLLGHFYLYLQFRNQRLRHCSHRWFLSFMILNAAYGHFLSIIRIVFGSSLYLRSTWIVGYTIYKYTHIFFQIKVLSISCCLLASFHSCSSSILSLLSFSFSTAFLNEQLAFKSQPLSFNFSHFNSWLFFSSSPGEVEGGRIRLLSSW